jgi:hypothetical protein
MNRFEFAAANQSTNIYAYKWEMRIGPVCVECGEPTKECDCDAEHAFDYDPTYDGHKWEP